MSLEVYFFLFYFFFNRGDQIGKLRVFSMYKIVAHLYFKTTIFLKTLQEKSFQLRSRTITKKIDTLIINYSCDHDIRRYQKLNLRLFWLWTQNIQKVGIIMKVSLIATSTSGQQNRVMNYDNWQVLRVFQCHHLHVLMVENNFSRSLNLQIISSHLRIFGD